tara:strand:- start:26 stop:379 length:354 start_codon:yes stop_codon:yes gene_type:complete
MIMKPGRKELSKFMHSFKRNAMWDIRKIHCCEKPLTSGSGRSRSSAAVIETNEIEAPMFPKWQKGFHDRRIRTHKQYNAVLNYVQHNAFRHGLTGDAYEWPWSSLQFQDLIDPMEVQ